MVTHYLKDESPKAPVYIYAVNNDNKLLITETMSEEERTNMQTRQELMNLNQSLFMSEVSENVEMVIPFDTIDIGSKQKPHFANYKKDLRFHTSSL